MSKSQNFLIRTNHGGATNLSKLLKLENWAAQMTSGFGSELLRQSALTQSGSVGSTFTI